MTLRQLPVRSPLTAGALARAAVPPIFGRPGRYGLPVSLPGLQMGETVYHAPSPPAGTSDVSLGVLLATAALLNPEAETRRKNAGRLLMMVEESPDSRAIRGPEAGPPGWLRLPLLADDRPVGRLEQREAGTTGVMSSYPRPLYRLPPLREGLDAEEAGPLYGAGRLARSLYTPPTHGLLRPRDLRAIRRLLDGGSESGGGAGPDRHRDRESETGTPADTRALAVLSAASLAAYLAFSAAPRAFLERASTVLATLLGLVG